MTRKQQLFCGVEFNSLIACQIDWKLHTKTEDVATELPADIEISLSLTKRRPESDGDPEVQQDILNDEAYREKTYHLRLEKGSFEVPKRTTYFYTPVYTYRLLWDVSPYPPLEEWSYQDPAEGGKYYERKDFYKGDTKK